MTNYNWKKAGEMTMQRAIQAGNTVSTTGWHPDAAKSARALEANHKRKNGSF